MCVYDGPFTHQKRGGNGSTADMLAIIFNTNNEYNN